VSCSRHPNRLLPAVLQFIATRFVAALIITALSLGFDATHPLMSSITTSLDPKYRGQITGFATFANFLGMGAGALCFQHLIAFGFSSALAIFASGQTLLGFAALYAFRRERPSRTRSVEFATAQSFSSRRQGSGAQQLVLRKPL